MIEAIRPLVVGQDDPNLLTKVEEFLTEFDNTEYNTAVQVEILFHYHNLLTGAIETGKSCPPCRARTRNRLAEWVLKTKDNQ